MLLMENLNCFNMNKPFLKKSIRLLLIFFSISSQIYATNKLEENNTPIRTVVKENQNENKKELIELRDAYSKTFVSPDGSYTKQQGFLPIHYLDKNNNWKEYENVLKEKNNGKFELSQTDLPVYLDVLTGKTTMTLESKTNKAISFGDNSKLSFFDKFGVQTYESTISQKFKKEVVENSVTFLNAWDNINRKQNFSIYEIETDYIIETKPLQLSVGGELVFTEFVQLPNGWTIIKGNGKETKLGWEGELKILDEEKQEKALFQTPVFYDSNTKRQYDDQVIQGNYRFSVKNNVLELNVVVSNDWLLAQHRVYPVTIDPIVTNQLAQYSSFNLNNFDAACQSTLNVNVPLSEIVNTSSTWSVQSYNDGWMSEAFSRIGRGANWTGEANFPTNASGTVDWTLNASAIANGHHPGGNVTYTWQGRRTWGGTGCNQTYQRRVNNWVVNVDYLPCSLGYNIAGETAAPTIATGCANGTIPVGGGAFRDVTIAANTYYNFTAPATLPANVNNVRITPTNGGGNGGVVTLTGGQVQNNWFSGTTTNIRISTNRISCVWSATSTSLLYRHSQPSIVTVSGGGTQCGGTLTLTATGGTSGTIYWQNTTNNGTSTANSNTSNSVSASGTYYYRANNNGCWGQQGSAAVTIGTPANAGTLSGNQNICVANTTTFSSTSAGGSWSSSNTGIATVNASTGVVTGVAAGTATITYTATGTGGCPNATATRTVAVAAPPSAGTLSGNQNICIAGTSTFSSTVNGGSWTTSNPSVATVNAANGLVTGVAAGSATITYTVSGTNGCPNATATRIVTVTAPPSAGTLSGNQNICVSNTITFSSTVNGGSWTTSNPSVATVNAATGVVTGVAAGSSVITYTVSGSGGCPNATATRTVTVTAAPSAGVLAGIQEVCIGATTTFSSSVNGGTWTTDDPAIASINTTSGLITGVAAGSTFATYTVSGTGGCANATATRNITVNAPSVVADSIDGISAICIGSNTTLNVSGGSLGTGANWQWYISSCGGTSVGNGVSINVSPTSTTTYFVRAEGTCGNTICVQKTVTVDPLPAAGSATATITNICEGQSSQLELSGFSGDIQWQANNGSGWNDLVGEINSILNTGILSDTTQYRAMVSNGACSGVYSNVITINVSPNSVGGIISSASPSICKNTLAQLTLNGNIGSVQWQIFDNVNNTWGNINGATGTSYNSLILTENTFYRATVTSGVCSSVFSNEFEVIVDSLTDLGNVSINSNSICEGDSILLQTLGSVGSLQWQENILGTWTDIVGAIDTTFNSSSLFASTEYRLLSKNGACATLISPTFLVNVDSPSDAGLVTTQNDTICFGFNTILSTTGYNGNLQWQIFNNNTWQDISGETFDTLNTGVLIQTETYRLIATNGVCAENISSEIEVFVNILPDEPIVSNQSLCETGQITFNPGVNANEVIDWSTDASSVFLTDFQFITAILTAPDTFDFFVRARDTLTACISDWVAVSAIAFENLTNPVLTDLEFCGTSEVIYSSLPPQNAVSDWSLDGINPISVGIIYNAGIIPAISTDSIYVRYRDTLTGCESDWVLTKAFVYEIPSAPIISDEIICGNGTVTVISNPPLNHLTQWAEDTLGTINTNISYTTASLTANDTVLLYVRYNDNVTGCIGDWGTVNAIASIQLSPGSIGNTQDICIDAFPLLLSETTAATSSTVGGTINYEWQFSDNCTGIWTSIPNSNSVNYTEATSFIGQRCYRRVATNNCGTISSNEVTIFVFTPQTATINGLLSEYCSNDAPVQLSPSPSNGILTGNGISGNTFNPSLAGIGLITITYDFTDSNGCKTEISQNTTVHDIPTINITSINPTYCSNDNQTVNLIASPPGGTFSGNGVAGNGFTPSNSQVGQQSITYTFTDNNNCTNSGSINAEILIAPTPIITGLADTVCNTSPSFIINVNPSGGTLTGNHTNNVVFPSQLPIGNQTFTYSYTAPNGCSETVSDNIWIRNGTNILANDSTFTLFGGSTLEASITNNDNGLWNYFDVYSIPNEGNFTQNSNGTISYNPPKSFFGKDSLFYIICDLTCDNCDSAKVLFNVLKEEIIVPTAFSPDGDGINDFFVILGLLDRYPQNEITIFNRWGNKVFEDKPYKNNWDGTSLNSVLRISGNVVPDGTYFYVLKLNDTEKPLKGYIELKRNRK
jgi:trimeric autotransporter adhesin